MLYVYIIMHNAHVCMDC